MVKSFSALMAAVFVIEASALLADAYCGRHAVDPGYQIVRDVLPAEDEHSHGRAPRDGTMRVRWAVSGTSADVVGAFMALSSTQTV